MFTPRENNRLLDYYKIIFISRPILANMDLDFVSGQYGCLFSRCRKYVINSLIHGHFHIGLVIIPRPILALDCVSGQYGGLGTITRPIWKYLCILICNYCCSNWLGGFREGDFWKIKFTTNSSNEIGLIVDIYSMQYQSCAWQQFEVNYFHFHINCLVYFYYQF